MKPYKTLKRIASKTGKVAAIGIIAALPYVCEGCGYKSNSVKAAENAPVYESQKTLEAVLKE